jgi:midasin (ATPase involved in ribosome maturation)
MAPASVLECLSQLLENEGSITLYEDFRLFSCMNPATTLGRLTWAPA